MSTESQSSQTIDRSREDSDWSDDKLARRLARLEQAGLGAVAGEVCRQIAAQHEHAAKKPWWKIW